MVLRRLLAVVVVAVAALASITAVDGYCWQPGKNPTFTKSPTVEQISISRVRVSWKGKVSMRECADQFLVKYWQRNEPTGYKLTELFGVEVNHIDIDVVPKVPHVFQAVAREDKGDVMGVEWNKSPEVTFQTSNYNDEIDEPPPNPDNEYAQENGPTFGTTAAPTRGDPRRVVEDEGISYELMAMIIVGGFIVALIAVGLMYRCFRRKKPSDVDTEEDLESDTGGADEGPPADEQTSLTTDKIDG